MPNTDLGKVSLTPRGAYDPAASYEPLDVVEYQGSGYIVRRSVQGVAPVDGEDYMLVVQKGDTGVGVPDGGTEGQLLGRTADGTAWVDPPQSGGGVQSDWNQNDETAPDYVKNRMGGYIKFGDASNLFSGDVTFESGSSGESMCSLGGLDLVEGNLVSITINVDTAGMITREGIVKKYSSFLYVGNISLIGAGENTGEDFVLINMGPQTSLAIIASVPASSSLIIDHAHPSAIPLDPKFLPEIPSTGLVVASSTPSSTKKFAITVDDTGTISATEVT